MSVRRKRGRLRAVAAAAVPAVVASCAAVAMPVAKASPDRYPGPAHARVQKGGHQQARHRAAAARPPVAGHVRYRKGARGFDPTITVNIGGNRVGTSNTVTGLAGVTFRATGNTVAADTGTCTTNAAGTCTINVTSAVTQTYTVAPEGPAPAGWFETPGLGVSNTTPPPAANPTTAYTTVTTPSLGPGGSATVPVANTGTASTTARTGQIAYARTDIPEPTECGLRVGMAIDLSSSITQDLIGQYRSAAQSLVTALEGTPSEVAVHTFGTNSPATSGTVGGAYADNSNAGLEPVATTQGADAVRAKIGQLNVVGSQYTNWDAGINSFTASGEKYDVVIVLTDGDPTRYGRPNAGTLPGGVGVWTRFADVENGIFSANEVKSSEGHAVAHPAVLAVGITTGGTTSPGSTANLRAISGDGDYYVTDFDHLGEQLRNLAHSECRGTISVVKNIIPEGKGIADARPGGDGWSFTSTTPAETRETDDTSSVNFDTSQTAPAPTTITEHGRSHYTFRPGLTTCHIPGSHEPVTYTRHENGLTVTPNVDEPVVCDVYNEGPTPGIRITKDAWPTEYGVAGEELRYTFTVTNTGGSPLHDVSVHDDKLGPIECPRNELGIGEHMTCEFIHHTTDEDLALGDIHNVARATGRDPQDVGVEDEDDATVREVHGPHIELEKVAFPTRYAVPGEVITYTYRVANTGNVTLHDVALHDSRLGAVTCPRAELEPGQEMECEGRHAITQDDIEAGHIHNVGTVTGLSPGDEEVSGRDEATVDAHHGPGFELEKLAEPGTFSGAGQTVRYTYRAANTGNVILHDIRVEDDRIGQASCERTTLAPGEETTCTAAYTVTPADVERGYIPNFAYAQGDRPDGQVVTTDEVEAIVTHLPEVPVTG